MIKKIVLKFVLTSALLTFITHTTVYAQGTAFLQNITLTATGFVTGAGVLIAVMGLLKLVESYGDDAPSGKSSGIKTLMIGGGIAFLGTILFPALTPLFSIGAGAEGAFVAALAGAIRAIIMGIGGAIGIYGAVNLFEGYGGDNPAAKSQGKKQLIAGLGLGLLASSLTGILQQAVLGGGFGAVGQIIQYLGNIVTAVGAGMAIWGVVNLIEGYGADNPASKAQGIKQLVAGSGMIPLGLFIVGPLTSIALSGTGIENLAFIAAQAMASVATGLGVALGIWGIANLIEGYGGDAPAAKAHGIKQFMSAVGLIAIGNIMVMIVTSLASLTGAEFVVVQVIEILGRVVIAIGVGLGLWGLVNLFEAYGADAPGGKSQGIKQFMIAVSLVVLGTLLPGALTPFVMGSQDAGSFIENSTMLIGSIIAAVGGGIAAWGIINLVEAYGSDSIGSKAQGIKQFVTGCVMMLSAIIVPPALAAVLNSI